MFLLGELLFCVLVLWSFLMFVICVILIVSFSVWSVVVLLFVDLICSFGSTISFVGVCLFIGMAVESSFIAECGVFDLSCYFYWVSGFSSFGIS